MPLESPNIGMTPDGFTTLTCSSLSGPEPSGRIIEYWTSSGALRGPQKIVGQVDACTLVVRELKWFERWLYWWAKRFDRWEGQWARDGFLLVMGYPQGSFKPRWSPSRWLLWLAEL